MSTGSKVFAKEALVCETIGNATIYCVPIVFGNHVVYQHLKATFQDGKCIGVEPQASAATSHAHTTREKVIRKLYGLHGDSSLLKTKDDFDEVLHPRFAWQSGGAVAPHDEWLTHQQRLQDAGVKVKDVAVHASAGDVCMYSVGLQHQDLMVTLHNKATFEGDRLCQIEPLNPTAIDYLIAAVCGVPWADLHRQFSVTEPATEFTREVTRADEILQQLQDEGPGNVTPMLFNLFNNFDKADVRQHLRDLFGELGTLFNQPDLGGLGRELEKDTFVEEHDLDGDGLISFDDFLPIFRRMLKVVMRSTMEIKQLEAIAEDRMQGVKDRLAQRTVFQPDAPIRHVVVLIVVAEEIKPVLDKFSARPDTELDAKLMNLATAYSCTVGEPGSPQSYRLTILQAAQSPIYHRHYSGYTQAAAIVTLVARDLNCDLLVSFGTAGGVEGQVDIGDTVLCDGCVYLDRTRTNNKQAHDWGVYAGPVVPSPNLAGELGVKEGAVASHINYVVTHAQLHLIEHLGIVALDMEAAPEAEIAQQVGLNFLVLKVISDRVFTSEEARASNEEEYQRNKARVSEAAVKTLTALLHFLQGRRPCDL